jgi:hypothetical protein
MRCSSASGSRRAAVSVSERGDWIRSGRAGIPAVVVQRVAPLDYVVSSRAWGP